MSIALIVGCRSDISRVLAPHNSLGPMAGALRRAGEPLGPVPCDPNYIGPLITLVAPGLEFHYPTGGYCPSCPGAEVPLDVPANHTVTIHWSADGSSGCTEIHAYKWALDLADLFDTTPRTDEATDLAHWSQPSLATTSATVGPFALAQPGPHFFYVDAMDATGRRSLGIIRINVVADTNHDPDVGNATAELILHGPPNGNFSPVRISGVIDPDGDAVSITVVGVTQDEPLLGRGTRPTCPDARLLQGGAAAVRRERSGFGNGRVYTIEFVATDGHGGSSRGTVDVCIPRDRGHDDCVRDGLVVNSLESCGGPIACRPHVR